MFNEFSPLPALIVVILAVTSCFMILKMTGSPEKQGKFVTISGLRGYLALFVFIHHSSIWYFFLQSSKWELPPVHLYAHLGKWGVYAFFMITGFLFFTKLLEGRKKEINWPRLFMSRFLRLVPLYVFAMLCVFLIVAYRTHGILLVPISDLIRQMLTWLSLSVFGMPDINSWQDTARIIASVVWSVPYECFFYLSLPALALLAGVVPPLRYLGVGIASIVLFILWRPESTAYVFFASGIAAALLVKSDAICRYARHKSVSVAIIAALTAAVIIYPTAKSSVVSVLLSLSFFAIACGNTMFGILTARPSIILGEISYSMYLMHGITLYVIFELMIGVDRARELSPEIYWSIIFLATPVLVLLCFVTFRLIEYRPMHSVDKVMAALSKRSNGRA